MKFIFTLISFLFFSFLQAQEVSLTWAKAMGGTGSDVGYSVAVDGSGNVYTTGYFVGTVDFNPDPAVTNNLTFRDVQRFLKRAVQTIHSLV